MKKYLLIAVLGLVALALGMNWYYTREIRQQLDRLSAAVAMFGQLTYDGVHLSPTGSIHIDELEFRPRQAGLPEVGVERVSLDTGGLTDVIALKGRLESGELPPELGIRIRGLSLPFDALPDTAAVQDSGASIGLPFAAAGCDGRRVFDLDDLARMDYLRWIADVEMHYRIVDRGARLEPLMRVRNRDAADLTLEAELDLRAGSMSAAAIMAAAQRADLRSFSLRYEDLGFYDRMLDFCADETDMTRAEYVQHHVQAWRTRWSQVGGEPRPELVEAYRDFIESPDRLRIATRSQYSVPVLGIGQYSLPAFLARMDTTVVVNASEPVPVALDPVTTAPRTAAAPEADAQSGSAPAEAAPSVAGASSRASSSGAGPRWTRVQVDALGTHVGRRIRIDRDDQRHVGVLEAVEPDRIRIRVQGVGGYYVRPLDRAAIASASVLLDES